MTIIIKPTDLVVKGIVLAAVGYGIYNKGQRDAIHKLIEAGYILSKDDLEENADEDSES